VVRFDQGAVEDVYGVGVRGVRGGHVLNDPVEVRLGGGQFVGDGHAVVEERIGELELSELIPGRCGYGVRVRRGEVRRGGEERRGDEQRR
jgi:hypothetical protein